MKLSRSTLLALLITVGLAGCVSKAPAPVSERSPAQVSPTTKAEVAPPPKVARPGYYIVRPGDTLIRIALDHGQNYRDIAAWSGLENPNLIEVGQELRVRPPENAAVARPVTSSQVEVRPVGGTAPVVPADGLRREPKGGKVPYSEQAWTQAQKPDAPMVVAKVDPRPEVPKTEARPTETKPEPKPENKPEIKAPPEGAIDWAWPTSGKVIAGFNETSSKGVDLAGKVGDPVLAAASGRVVYAGTGLRGYGKLVIVKHDNSYLSAYAHNQNLLVKEGQAVSKGQKIAELGDTDSDRPKLHFEIRRQGKPVDPGKYLPAR
ncbi:peptidoglycan DD-metalloendopeptidase family protein [Zoogloea sp.]|uniref:peptidoglycan DD-metalloendopeptidase family protein n=1 Tax=Zoogloea sp. TaxID=49181 RepID=UPI0026158E25|nr:peptidoglycan DD-metalloendopeptidase family protein [Zoogloea sp.]MDD3354359.1 peptidoglycan DD-metalloendopeptidase family protein [Zoogloea sp.]